MSLTWICKHLKTVQVHLGFTLPFDERKKMSRVLVQGIPGDVSEDELSLFFSQFGHVIDAGLKHDPRTGHRTGDALISYDCYESAASVLALGDNLILHGRKVKSRTKITFVPRR